MKSSQLGRKKRKKESSRRASFEHNHISLTLFPQPACPPGPSPPTSHRLVHNLCPNSWWSANHLQHHWIKHTCAAACSSHGWKKVWLPTARQEAALCHVSLLELSPWSSLTLAQSIVDKGNDSTGTGTGRCDIINPALLHLLHCNSC